MARRRGQRKGWVYRKGPSWLLQYREDVRNQAGDIARAKFTRTIADAVGPQALTKKQAQRLAWDQFLSKLDKVSIHPQSMATVREFINNRFLPDYVSQLEPGGQAHYDTVLKHILRVGGAGIADLRLRDVNLERVQRFFNDLRQRTYTRGKSETQHHYSHQTLVHIRNVLSAIFGYAEDLNYFSDRLPTKGLRLGEGRRRARRALSEQQVRALLDALPTPYREMAITVGCHGMRIGELCGLTWKRVLWDEGVFEIVDSWDPTHGYRPTKTKQSERKVPIVTPVLEILRAMFATTKWNGPDDPVFPGKTGRPIDRSNAQTRYIAPAAKALGLDGVSWHYLRHTLATMAKDEGVDMGDRKLILGHGTDAMAIRYSHASIEKMRDPLERIAERLLKVDKPAGLIQ